MAKKAKMSEVAGSSLKLERRSLASLHKYENNPRNIEKAVPQDYDFLSNKPQYVCGMSVPPVMMANIAAEVYDQVFRGEEHGQNDTSATG